MKGEMNLKGLGSIWGGITKASSFGSNKLLKPITSSINITPKKIFMLTFSTVVGYTMIKGVTDMFS